MADSTLNRFLARGTAAERAAFTPDPPTPASGPDPLHVWYETDTGDTYAWDGSAWDQVNTGSGSGIDIEDEGASEATGATTLNFTGAGVTATDAGGGVVDVDIPGGGSFRGALVTKAADQTAANYSANTAIGWDTESYDTDSIHDNVTNNSRLTVPSGVTKVRLTGQIHLTLISDVPTVRIGKNGGVDNYPGAASANMDSGVGTKRLNVSSPVLTVTAGDYFELFLVTGGDTSITVEADSTWFAMHIIA